MFATPTVKGTALVTQSSKSGYTPVIRGLLLQITK